MEKEFVPYELAVELKKMGFDEHCLSCYLDGEFVVKLQSENKQFEFFNNSTFSIDNSFASPLFQQAFRWFREKYNLHPLRTGNEYYTAYSLNMGFLSYERKQKNKDHFYRAEIECLKQLIKIAKNEPK